MKSLQNNPREKSTVSNETKKNYSCFDASERYPKHKSTKEHDIRKYEKPDQLQN